VTRPDWQLRPHGTAAAYKRHYRRGETPCETCRRAETLRVAEWRERTGYDADRRDRYRAARAAGLDNYDAQALRSTRRFQQAMGGAS
jgi:hypothetical protein